MQAEAHTLRKPSSKMQPSYHKKTKPYAGDDDRKIGIQMLIAREEIGMTRMELADLLYVTQQQIEKYEKGNNRISARTLFIISKLFSKPMEWFTQGLGDPTNENFLKHTPNRLSTRIVKKIHHIKDKPTQDKIIKIIKIIVGGE